MADQNTAAQGEIPLQTQVMRVFRGVNTKAQRSAIPPDSFYDLENIIPLGNANAHVVPNISASLTNFASDTIYAAQFGMVASVPYLFCYSSTGKIIAWNLNAATATTISTGHPASGVKMAPWYNVYALFVDSAGYYSWDGTTFSTLALADGPTVGTDIAVCFGRVWVCSGRLIQYSGVYVGTTLTDPTQDTAWLPANGGGFVNMTDPALVGIITRLLPQNGYLYIFGQTCVFAVSDLYVPTGANPPTPVFTITPVQSIIGTNQSFSVFPLNRALMFANSYGAWAIEGVNAIRISEDLDGTWQYLSSSAVISGGQCVVESILNAAFLIQRANDPVFGSNTVVAMWFDNRWWFANYGAITFIVSAVINDQPALFGFIGNQLYELFQDPTTAPNVTIMTPLWSMDDPLTDKQMLRAGVELVTNIVQSTASVSLTADGVNLSAAIPVALTTGTITFVSTSGATLQFTGAGSAPIYFTVENYQLCQGPAPGTWSKYVGMTLKTVGLGFELDSFLMDYKMRKRW